MLYCHYEPLTINHPKFDELAKIMYNNNPLTEVVDMHQVEESHCPVCNQHEETHCPECGRLAAKQSHSGFAAAFLAATVLWFGRIPTTN